MNFINLATLFSTVEILRLSNGIPVLVQKEPFAEHLLLQAVVRTSNLPASEIGAMEVLAEAMSRETQNISSQRLGALTYLLGGNAHVYCKDGAIVFEIVTLPSFYSPAIGVLSEILLHQEFSEDTLFAASEKVRQRYRKLYEDPIHLLLSRFRTRLASGQAALNIEFLPPPLLNEITAKNLYSKNVRPEQIAFSVVGNISSEAIAKRLNQSFGDWKPSPINSHRFENRKLHSRLRSKQTEFSSRLDREGEENTTKFHLSAVAVSGPRVSSAEFPAWIVAMNAIGGGKSSRMQSYIRYKMAWAYASGVAFSFRHDKSWAMFYCIYRKTPDSFDRARKRTEMLEELLRTFKKGLSKEETKRAIRYSEGQYRSGESNPYDFSPFGGGHRLPSERAFWAAWWELEGVGAQMDSLFLEKIVAITQEDLNQTIQKSLHNPSTFAY